MKIQISKKSLTIGGIISAAIIAFIIIKKDLWFENTELDRPGLLFGLTVLLALGVGACIAMRFKFEKAIIPKIISYAVLLLSPVVSITMVECFDSIFSYDMSVKYFIANYIVYLIHILACYAITGGLGLTIVITNAYFYAFGLTNNIVCTFRGTPFLPTDFSSIGTAANVIGTYEPYIDFSMVMATLMFVMLCIIGMKMKKNRLKGKPWIISRIASGGVVFLALTIFFATDIVPDAGFKPDFWNQLRGYHKSGSFFNYNLNMKYLRVSKPDGYDPDEIEDIVEELASQSDYVATCEEGDYPNIICIMNETWTDLSEINDIETNVSYNEFYSSLSENCIKGYVSVPVMGAGTSNSEFEFLTGMSLSFLTSGSNVYDLYLKNETPSLTTQLEELGYSSLAFHPYYGDGWNREVVYPLLGFDDFISIEDIFPEYIIETYKENQNVYELESMLSSQFPGKDIILRRYVSDSYDFEVVEQMYEEHEEENDDQPFYLFNVTMQNHGGYTVSYSNFFEEVSIEGMTRSYSLANQFVSLMKKTDEALAELVEYFENIDEPTIILMFGDHHPYVETAFYEELFGKSLDDLTNEELQRRYKTPFLIWANYDIDPEEDEVEDISANYLATLMLKTAGLPLTDYEKYLDELYGTLPIIDSVGFKDSEGNYYSYTDDTEYQDLLDDYEKVQYNNLIDSENRIESLYTLH